MGTPVLNLHDRSAMDLRMLCYTTSPLTEELQITGTPMVNLNLSSNHKDGAVLVYLEIVSTTEDGAKVSRYVTEGGLRLIHRKLSKDPDFPDNNFYRSFAKDDATLTRSAEILCSL